jgi:acyl dehydratase
MCAVSVALVGLGSIAAVGVVHTIAPDLGHRDTLERVAMTEALAGRAATTRRLGCGAMSDAASKAFELFQADVGNDEGTGEWFEVTQDQIDQFAEVTHDHQFIHVDPERAKDTPFGTTIAHGFLTLSMLTKLSQGASSSAPDPAKYEGVLMGINYGFNKVRFVSPVKVGSRIRARGVTANVELKGTMVEVTRSFTVEIEGEEKPALVADWLTRTVYA